MADDGTEDNMFSGEDQSGLDSSELRGGDYLTGTDDVMKNDPALLDEALDGNENDQVAFCLTQQLFFDESSFREQKLSSSSMKQKNSTLLHLYTRDRFIGVQGGGGCTPPSHGKRGCKKCQNFPTKSIFHHRLSRSM